MMTNTPWYEIDDIAAIASPALVVYRERAIRNIERLITSAGSPERLRPHVKTHKMEEVVRLMIDRGITRFKCATMEEAAMLGNALAPDVLLAYQPVGPNAAQLLNLQELFPATRFSAIFDHAEAATAVSELFSGRQRILDSYIDLNVGMNRTGIGPADAPDLARHMHLLPGLKLIGLHAYDGHLHVKDPSVRNALTMEAFSDVYPLKKMLETFYNRPLTLIAGGSPTYLFHAANVDTELSPGTFVFWDSGYLEKIPEQPFEVAALVVSRVISIPGQTIICVDLGYKSVASENPLPRIGFLNAPEAVPLAHSEEHLTLSVPDASDYFIGQVLYGVPKHICPTVSLYGHAWVIEDHRLLTQWKISRR